MVKYENARTFNLLGPSFLVKFPENCDNIIVAPQFTYNAYTNTYHHIIYILTERSFYAYNVELNSFTKITYPPISIFDKRCAMCTDIYGQLILFAPTSTSPYNVFYSYDPSSDTWYEMANISLSSPFTKPVFIFSDLNNNIHLLSDSVWTFNGSWNYVDNIVNIIPEYSDGASLCVSSTSVYVYPANGVNFIYISSRSVSPLSFDVYEFYPLFVTNSNIKFYISADGNDNIYAYNATDGLLDMIEITSTFRYSLARINNKSKKDSFGSHIFTVLTQDGQKYIYIKYNKRSLLRVPVGRFDVNDFV